MVRLSVRGRYVVVAFLFLLFTLVHTLPLKAEEQMAGPSGETSATTAVDEGGKEGIASYYAKSYNGKRTTSGKRYHPEKLTAAHPDLPLGTKVRVVNLSNGKDVVVTINDRCRKRKAPFIDLSRAAAQQLGFFGKGIARVRIIPLEGDSPA
ncbi:MAG: septal ring lytic transglycosylase RlpA family protein [Geobacter sp.]|nr:septal ring lytic transglycosylase RlpA family protein [Geobacter sp.]